MAFIDIIYIIYLFDFLLLLFKKGFKLLKYIKGSYIYSCHFSNIYNNKCIFFL